MRNAATEFGVKRRTLWRVRATGKEKKLKGCFGSAPRPSLVPSTRTKEKTVPERRKLEK